MSIKWSQRRYSKSVLLDEETDILPQKHRHSSLTPCHPLEEMVSCPIHLGVMDRPVQLPCGHSFCLVCLERCIQSYVLRNNTFPCPVCRCSWPVPLNGPRGWPISFALNNVIEYVHELRANNKKSNNQEEVLPGTVTPTSTVESTSTTNSASKKNSIIEKAELIKKLLEDLETKTYLNNSEKDKLLVVNALRNLYSKLDNITPTKKNSIGNIINKDKMSPLSKSRRSSSLEMCDRTHSTRQEMRGHCEYKIYPIKLNTSLLSEALDSLYWDCIDYDDDEDPFYKITVFVDVNMKIAINNYQTESTIRFDPTGLSGQKLIPVYLKLYHDHIYMSGLITSEEDGVVQYGQLVKYDLEGNLVASSDAYVKLDPRSEHWPVAGFDIDAENNVFLAMPEAGSIFILDPEFREHGSRFVFPIHSGAFDNNARTTSNRRGSNSSSCSGVGSGSGNQHRYRGLRPQYVCYSRTKREIWASCPDNESILILDEVTGCYTQFGTSQLYGSLPSHIVCTQDDRICFLDSRQSRIYWLRREQHQYLCIQRLVFDTQLKKSKLLTTNKIIGGISETCIINSLHGYPNSNRLFLCTDKGIFHAKPVKDVSFVSISKNTPSCCSVM